MKLALDSLLLGLMLISAIMGFALSLLAYLRGRTKKLLAVVSVFSIFLVKGVLLSAALFLNELQSLEGGYTLIFDIGVMAVLLFFTFLE